VLKLDVNNAEAYYNRGLCHDQIGDFENSKKDLEKALSLGLEKAEKMLLLLLENSKNDE
jgi:tetratricopeptide (TPR) repeat protein